VKAVKMSDKKSKRKRQDESESVKVKKAKKDDEKTAKAAKTAESAPKDNIISDKDQAAVARKITKLSPKKKATYGERAALKNQTLDEYILRRIQKKSSKSESSKPETRYDEPDAPVLFFTDLEGDATLPQKVTTAKFNQPVLGDLPATTTSTTPAPGNADEAAAISKPAPADNPTDDAAPTAAEMSRRKAKLREKQKKKKPIKAASRADVRGKRKEKKALKKERKAETRAKSKSKFGPNKATNSRWAKVKVEKRAAKAAQKGE
jgi:hypothetical protein